MSTVKKTLLRVLAALLYLSAAGCAFLAVVPLVWGAPHRFILWSITGSVMIFSLFFGTLVLQGTLPVEQGKRLVRTMVYLFFAAYVVAVAYLLFIMRRGTPFTLEELKALDLMAYAETDNMNLVPFATLHRYMGVAKRGVIVRIAVGNLLGNAVLLLPLGVLLPLLGKKIGKPYVALPILLVVPVVLEVLQLVLRCGIADIDDVIFNAVGGMLSYGLMWLPFLRKPLQKGHWWPQ